MNPLWPSLRRIAADLAAAHVGFALVGGLAASSRTEPRFTRDVDLAVSVADDAAAEALVRRLLGAGYRATSILEQEVTGRLSTVRLLPPDEVASGAVIDLLFASSGIESDVVREAEPTALAAGLTVPVARTGHLIAMKLLSDSSQRPQDRVDLVHLVQHADAGELARAEAAVALIDERGFSRGRSLRALLGELLDDLQ